MYFVNRVIVDSLPVLDKIEKLEAEKAEFKKNVIPVWLEEAREREAKMDSASPGSE